MPSSCVRGGRFELSYAELLRWNPCASMQRVAVVAGYPENIHTPRTLEQMANDVKLFREDYHVSGSLSADLMWGIAGLNRRWTRATLRRFLEAWLASKERPMYVHELGTGSRLWEEHRTLAQVLVARLDRSAHASVRMSATIKGLCLDLFGAYPDCDRSRRNPLREHSHLVWWAARVACALPLEGVAARNVGYTLGLAMDLTLPGALLQAAIAAREALVAKAAAASVTPPA